MWTHNHRLVKYMYMSMRRCATEPLIILTWCERTTYWSVVGILDGKPL
jgi:hypothetical protein